MLAEFSVMPLGKLNLSKDIARIVEVLEGCGIKYTVGPLGTCLEGTMDDIFAAIRKCHEAIARDNARVVTHIKLYDRKDNPHSLKGIVNAVESHLGRRAFGGRIESQG
jgi:uncharacterized protein (TIGR00106 family)